MAVGGRVGVWVMVGAITVGVCSMVGLAVGKLVDVRNAVASPAGVPVWRTGSVELAAGLPVAIGIFSPGVARLGEGFESTGGESAVCPIGGVIEGTPVCKPAVSVPSRDVKSVSGSTSSCIASRINRRLTSAISIDNGSAL